MMSQQEIQYLNEIRMKSLAGTATQEEYKEAIRLMRGSRVAAATSASETAKRIRAKKEIPSADSLLDDLMGG